MKHSYSVKETALTTTERAAAIGKPFHIDPRRASLTEHLCAICLVLIVSSGKLMVQLSSPAVAPETMLL